MSGHVCYWVAHSLWESVSVCLNVSKCIIFQGAKERAKAFKTSQRPFHCNNSISGIYGGKWEPWPNSRGPVGDADPIKAVAGTLGCWETNREAPPLLHKGIWSQYWFTSAFARRTPIVTYPGEGSLAGSESERQMWFSSAHTLCVMSKTAPSWDLSWDSNKMQDKPLFESEVQYSTHWQKFAMLS